LSGVTQSLAMKKTTFFFACLFGAATCMSQDKTGQKFDRETLSYPPYDSGKIAKLVRDEVKKQFEEKERTRKHEPKTDDDDSDKVFAVWQPYLSPGAYGKLSLRERYVYHISYPEDYVQICGGLPVGGDSDKIGAQLPFFYQRVYQWSRRQDQFFRDNKDSVLAWIADDVQHCSRVGLNYKHAIIVCGDKKVIPLLIATYQREKVDHDILTVLLLMMQKAKYPLLLRSNLYTALYGPQSNRRSEIVASPDNEKAILALAKEYYAEASHGQ